MENFLLWLLHCHGTQKCPQRTKFVVIAGKQSCMWKGYHTTLHEQGGLYYHNIWHTEWILFHHTACTRDTITPTAFARDVIITSCIYKGYYHTFLHVQEMLLHHRPFLTFWDHPPHYRNQTLFVQAFKQARGEFCNFELIWVLELLNQNLIRRETEKFPELLKKFISISRTSFKLHSPSKCSPCDWMQRSQRLFHC
jgi:hypothetical protein